ncbi:MULTISPECIES: NADPH-dependent FMN reductase [Sinorhizobium]|uniref:NADPH-dependent FMN reductase n=2 Tax=Sinorhizobium TaxID=28105 RepID=A0A2S3YLW2_9HYPH|nr:MULTISPECIES: NADPH-dependent FMN reductase [Sinorhizobium]ASY57565.1 putative OXIDOREDUCTASE protein [Sinorhizobium sp. CCBAU 05631]AUX77325.1 NADPH-dependent FMN reductase protein [Sinorhizobium fredii]PDT42149.1 NAD(P)H-dependent oxidoreductase [Sinorhizobium sp. FG01]POH30069.1 NADPH-dependent FMN reductase [Sinorhizobium americanum]
MTKLLGISGSLRKASFNTGLLTAAKAVAPEEVEFEAATLHGIPLYDGDVEAESGVPAPVEALKQRIIAADGVILFTPEYNNSVPGVLKNAVDWLSRPAADIGKVFGGRPFALAGASPGNFGTILSQNAWLPVIRTLGAELWSGKRLMVPKARTVFDSEAQLTDEETRERLRAFVQAFAEYAATVKAHR